MRRFSLAALLLSLGIGPAFSWDVSELVGKHIMSHTPLTLNEQCLKMPVKGERGWRDEELCLPGGLSIAYYIYFTKGGRVLFLLDGQKSEGLDLPASGGQGQFELSDGITIAVNYRPTSSGIKFSVDAHTRADNFTSRQKTDSTVTVRGDSCATKSKVSGKFSIEGYYSKGRAQIVGAETCRIVDGGFRR
jgi:hypothetical protein